MVHCTVRPLRPEDEPQWRKLWTEYLEFYQATVPEAVYQTTFARLLSPDPSEFRGQVAVEDGQLVGLVHYLCLRTTWAEADTCYLQDLYADPSVRGKGIGRALIEAVYAAADREQAAGVFWFTAHDNQLARQLYDRIAVKTPFIRYRRP